MKFHATCYMADFSNLDFVEDCDWRVPTPFAIPPLSQPSLLRRHPTNSHLDKLQEVEDDEYIEADVCDELEEINHDH